MCGIAGTFSLRGDAASPVVLGRMAEALAHRGPDDGGIYMDRGVGLAHRRLAIIDLSESGHQPMLSRDGRYVLTYNGEIYNFNELRIELEARGHRFRSTSDSEVLLEAFAEWGIDALPRLNGMFAFAIWDVRKRELTLARDRFGVKPLYWTQSGNSFAFASEIKALFCHPTVSASVDVAGLVEYFSFQNFFSDRTLFSNIQMLPAGSWFSVSSDGIKGPVRWWDYSFTEPENPCSEQEYAEELDRLFRQAVKRQLVSDVEVSAYLSGGLDSASIVAVAAKELRELRTFTVGFDLSSASGLELAFDEREKAERISYLCGTEHYEMVLKAGDLERVMPRLAKHIEEPRVGQSYPNFYAAQLAGKFAKVTLAGTGGDELFAGYPWRYYRALESDDFDHYVSKYYDYWQRLIPPHAASSLFRPVSRYADQVDTRAIFRSVFRQEMGQLTRPEDYINYSLYFEARTFLHGLLVVEDKLSMAHGLETRVPFLDNDLVDFAMRIPVGLKLGNLGKVARINENDPGDKPRKYFEQNRDGKLILRRSMARYLPEDVSGARKQGFSAPDATWFKGDSIDYVRRLLLDPRSGIYDYLDRKTVVELVNDHLSGRENRRLLIWSLLSFENALRAFGIGRS